MIKNNKAKRWYCLALLLLLSSCHIEPPEPQYSPSSLETGNIKISDMISASVTEVSQTSGTFTLRNNGSHPVCYSESNILERRGEDGWQNVNAYPGSVPLAIEYQVESGCSAVHETIWEALPPGQYHYVFPVQEFIDGKYSDTEYCIAEFSLE